MNPNSSANAKPRGFGAGQGHPFTRCSYRSLFGPSKFVRADLQVRVISAHSSSASASTITANPKSVSKSELFLQLKRKGRALVSGCVSRLAV